MNKRERDRIIAVLRDEIAANKRSLYTGTRASSPSLGLIVEMIQDNQTLDDRLTLLEEKQYQREQRTHRRGTNE